jgi:hypothetical protein
METSRLIRAYAEVATPIDEPAVRRRWCCQCVAAGTWFGNPAVLQDNERRDSELAEARQYLEALEADPESDELTIVMARHEIFRHKGRIAAQLAME